MNFINKIPRPVAEPRGVLVATGGHLPQYLG